MQKVHIAVFASGTGTNAENLFNYFKENPRIAVSVLVCNRKGAPVIQKAIDHNVAVQEINRDLWQDEGYMLNMLASYKIDLIVLAGFLWLVPQFLVKAFPDRIINIHPALLPKYGGKGMYGGFVHEAVRSSGDLETGITIHLVDENYDEGKTLFQAVCPVTPHDTPDDIAKRVHELEYEHFPRVIESEAEKILNKR